MLWIIGYIDEAGHQDALDFAAMTHTEFQNRLSGYISTGWKVIKHPDRDEWAVPWDRERWLCLGMTFSERIIIRRFRATDCLFNKVKMVNAGWFPDSE